MGVRIVHCADFHLNSPANTIKEIAEIRRDELLGSLSAVIDLCINENAQVLLIAGDFFDTPVVDRNILKFVKKQFERLPVPILIATGNHDYDSPYGAYRSIEFPANVYVFSGETQSLEFPEIGLRVTGAGFSYQYINTPLIEDLTLPDDELVNIILLHGDLVSPGGSSQYNPIDIAKLAESGADYCALGHIHKRSKVEKVKGMSYSYCGCPEGKGFDETGIKGVYVGTVDKGSVNLEFRRISKRCYHYEKIDVSECETFDDICETVVRKISEKSKDDLFSIDLTGYVSPDTKISVDALLNRLKDYSFYCRISDETRIKVDYETVKNEFTLRGYFVKLMLNKAKNCRDSGDREGEEKYLKAIDYGLRAFEGEVSVNDN